MIRFIRSAIIIFVVTCFIAGCKDELIPATSESPAPATGSEGVSSPTDPFTTAAPVKAEPIPPSKTAKTPPPSDPWTQAQTDLPPAPASFAEPQKPAVEPPPLPVIVPKTEPKPPAKKHADEPKPPAKKPADEPKPPAKKPADEPEPPAKKPADEPKPPAPKPADEPKPPAPKPADEPKPPAPKPADEPKTPAVTEATPPDPFLMAPVSESKPVEKETTESEPIKVTSGNPLRAEPEATKTLESAPEAPVVAAIDETVPKTISDTMSETVPETVEISPSPQPPTPQPEPAKAEPVKAKSDDPLSELFVDWPKPKLLLVFTGFMNGYVEPCGCAGIDQMKGGLSRRHSFFKALEKKGWPVLPIDAGNLNKGFGSQEELKFSFVIDEAYRNMKYAAVGIGNRELLFPTDVLILYSVDSPGNRQRYTSANVAILEFNPEFTVPYRVFEEGGVKVGVVSVVAPSLLKNVNNQDIVHEDAVKQLKAILPQFAAEKCDKRVLLVHGNTPEIEKIVKAVPGQFDFVVPGDTPAEPPFRPRWIGDSLMIDVGEKGKFAVALGVYDDPDTPFRYERVPLDARFENSWAIVQLMQRYQEQLEKKGLDGLGIKPIPDRRAAENGKFVGSKVCADCHEPSYSVWKKSRHAKAWHSLVETSKPARTHDPECIACHVVGWNPAEFLPYENGFRSEKETPELLDVGCESCHGPGEMHVKAEQGSDEALQKKLRSAVRLPLEGNAARKNCITCHDGDNSPHFDFETYWPKIVHVESEE